MADLQQLEEIYQEYEEKLEEAEKGAGLLSGAFGMGDDPRKDACNQAFYEKLGGWAREFRDGQPEPREVAQGVDFILEYPFRHRESGTYWFAYAAQQHAMELIPLLEKQAAGALAERFARLYPKRERLPVQRRILEMLREQGGLKEKGAKKELLEKWLLKRLPRQKD